MATVTIADLPSLAGTLSDSALFPIEINGVTKKITATQLTSGRNIAALSLNTANLYASSNTVVGTNTGNQGFYYGGVLAVNAPGGTDAFTLTLQNANTPGYGLTITASETGNNYIHSGINDGVGNVALAMTIAPSGRVSFAQGITPRVAQSTTYSAWYSSITDLVSITAQTGTVTIGADSDGSTAVDGQKITFRIVGGAGGCTVTFDSGANYKFKGIGVTLPSSTAVASGVTMMLGAIYNANSLRWEVVALTQG